MQSSRKTILIGFGILLALGCAGGVFVWPQYRGARNVAREIASLQTKIRNSTREIQSLKSLAAQLDAKRRRYETDLKEIPENPKMATLIGWLTRDADGVVVLDQTFSTGRSGPATNEEKARLSALPLTIDMIAPFREVYSIVAAVESMDRLVRITSVRAERSDEFEGRVKATVALEAIYRDVEAEAERY